MKKILTNYTTALKIAGFVISFLAVFLPIYSALLDKPNIQVDLISKQSGNHALAYIEIKNIGLEPATNVRITSVPDSNIINYTLILYTEDIEFHQTGPQNLIGKMSRLANGQEVDFTTLLNSTSISDYAIFVTHDKGSTTYFYSKGGQQLVYAGLILALLSATVASLAAGISTNVVIRKYENKLQISGNNSMGFQDIVNSTINVQYEVSSTSTTIPSTEVPKSEPKPQARPTASRPTHGTLPAGFKPEALKPEPMPEPKLSTVSDQIRDILRRIGKEKISNLLQESKIIAIDTKDKEMQRWIELELNGYVPTDGSKLTRKVAKEKGLLPDYRDIKGKFLVQYGDGSMDEMNYPVLFGNSIKAIENTIESLKKGAKAFIPHTFPSNVKHLGGKSGDLELPLSELEGIVNAVEQKLSKFLESKLS